MFSPLFGVNVKPLLAQATPGIIPVIESYEPANLVRDIIAWAIILAVILCIIFIFIGGISFILSGGVEEKVKQAVSTIRYSIIGLIVVILSVALVNLVTSIFKVPFKFVNYQEIFNKVKSLGSIFEQKETEFDETE